MSRTYHHGERRIRVRGVPRDPADIRRMGRALIALERVQAEAEANGTSATSDNEPIARSDDSGPVITDEATTSDGDAA